MVIEQAPPTGTVVEAHAQPQVMTIDDFELTLPDQEAPPPETRMFALAMLLSAGMLLLITVGIALAVRGG